MINNLVKYIAYFPRRQIIGLINIYQKTFSPDHGHLKQLFPFGYCRHHPTCSEYGKQIVMKKGVIIGSFLLFLRILSCNPFNPVKKEKIYQTINNLSQD